MEPIAIAALVQAEHDATHPDPRDRRRHDAMTVRARRDEARRRTLLGQRIRTSLAGALRRAAGFIEPAQCPDSPLATNRA